MARCSLLGAKREPATSSEGSLTRVKRVLRKHPPVFVKPGLMLA